MKGLLYKKDTPKKYIHNNIHKNKLTKTAMYMFNIFVFFLFFKGFYCSLLKISNEYTIINSKSLWFPHFPTIRIVNDSKIGLLPFVDQKEVNSYEFVKIIFYPYLFETKNISIILDDYIEKVKNESLINELQYIQECYSDTIILNFSVTRILLEYHLNNSNTNPKLWDDKTVKIVQYILKNIEQLEKVLKPKYTGGIQKRQQDIVVDLMGLWTVRKVDLIQHLKLGSMIWSVGIVMCEWGAFSPQLTFITFTFLQFAVLIRWLWGFGLLVSPKA